MLSETPIDELALAAESPCGPDLFMDGDSEFMNFTVRAEGLLPAAFYSKTDGTPFSRTAVDFPAEVKLGEAIGTRTHDLRLLVLLTKLHALDRDPTNAVRVLEKMANLLERYWADVHPRPEDGDLSYRMATLQALDDNSHIVLPLQYSNIISHGRAGSINARMFLLRSRAIEPREDEQQMEATDFDRAVDEIDLDALRQARGLFDRLLAAITKLRAVWLDLGGYDQAVRFDLITAFAKQTLEAMTPYIVKREPTAGPLEPVSGDAGGEATATGAAQDGSGTAPIKSFADAEQAMAAAADFFARNEPSSPALPLIRQAQQLMGKSFLDVLRILAPEHVEAARLNIGKGPFIAFPIERLSEFSDLPEAEAATSEPSAFVAGNRQEAIRLLGRVNAFYAANEPSSPLPLFTERASALAGRDFLGIIKDVLPEEALIAIQKSLSEKSVSET